MPWVTWSLASIAIARVSIVDRYSVLTSREMLVRVVKSAKRRLNCQEGDDDQRQQKATRASQSCA